MSLGNLPLQALVALDRGVGTISGRMVDAAVSRTEQPSTASSPVEATRDLLAAVKEAGVGEGETVVGFGADELSGAAGSGLIECHAAERPKLTPLGEYLLGDRTL